ncbi:MAG: ribosome biogenesis factor YjgA [Gammaproteobacteria bacterium]
MSEDIQDNNEELVSKTQLKREMLLLQKLGEELIELNSKQLRELPLPEELLTAVQAAQKMTKNRALYRQRQYIGKVMRRIDADPIREALEKLRHPERESKARFHKVEHWRDLLSAKPDKTTDFVLEFPTIDRQQLGQKVRAAGKELKTGKPVGAGRALFRFIDSHIGSLEAEAE